MILGSQSHRTGETHSCSFWSYLEVLVHLQKVLESFAHKLGDLSAALDEARGLDDSGSDCERLNAGAFDFCDYGGC